MFEWIANTFLIKEEECEVGCEEGLKKLKELTDALSEEPDFEHEQPFWGKDASQ